ncbi:MAG TPA: bifunctional riboflavin kinase/FAD synthetase [Candidatus Omnitrophota bacterium]|nr:bifunctional riboflavin kinase/FAD synthetase [Candidatus Omnitrophota bacterium]HOX09082.1 bifunctional riboflavin kinase/FAD synthetase [Candidatus Omnitrophota bacterium]HPN66601.1 bifunctional riboflavin kinase/FAD synthetase [Candidatus Omnitrophota bacterium]
MSKTFAAIGIFDGVHRGHASIISTAAREAAKAGATGMAITFDPHPAKVINPGRKTPSIISTSHRIRLIKGLGIRKCEVIKFDRKFAGISPREFARDILARKYRVAKVFVGSNFVFGKGNSGDARALKSLGNEFGFAVKVVPMVKSAGRDISSTSIRKMITGGDLKGAQRMLGRPVSIFGTVISGRRRGRLLGYPTANIDPHHEAIPPGGIYAVWARVKGRTYGGALFIGAAPTFGEKEPSIEVHIFGLHEFIYREDIEVIFVKRLRSSRKFKDHSKLIEQIRRDDKDARKALGLNPNNALH